MALVYHFIVLLNYKILQVLIDELQIHCKYYILSTLILQAHLAYLSLSGLIPIFNEEQILEIKVPEFVVLLMYSYYELNELI